MTPSSSDPKITEDINNQVDTVINKTLKKLRSEISDYNSSEYASNLGEIPESHRWTVIRELHNKANDISGLTDAKRCLIGILCTYWLNNNRITKNDYIRGLLEYFTSLSDIVIDVPKIYEWTVQMICKCFRSQIENDNKKT